VKRTSLEADIGPAWSDQILTESERQSLEDVSVGQQSRAGAGRA
jgi:hypothetical protein